MHMTSPLSIQCKKHAAALRSYVIAALRSYVCSWPSRCTDNAILHPLLQEECRSSRTTESGPMALETSCLTGLGMDKTQTLRRYTNYVMDAVSADEICPARKCTRMGAACSSAKSSRPSCFTS